MVINFFLFSVHCVRSFRIDNVRHLYDTDTFEENLQKYDICVTDPDETECPRALYSSKKV